MTRVTVPGWEISDRCEASIVVVLAWERSAMNCRAAGGMAWSSVPTTAQLGMVAHAGGPDASPSAEAAIGGRNVATILEGIAAQVPVPEPTS